MILMTDIYRYSVSLSGFIGILVFNFVFLIFHVFEMDP